MKMGVRSHKLLENCFKNFAKFWLGRHFWVAEELIISYKLVVSTETILLVSFSFRKTQEERDSNR